MTSEDWIAAFTRMRAATRILVNVVKSVLQVRKEWCRFMSQSDKDWHHLFEVFAIFDTVLADQDGIHDPADSNDHLSLRLKGTMSTLGLHTIQISHRPCDP